jgi:tripartite-type tricarboxylate transporter receptor subunit TctC
MKGRVCKMGFMIALCGAFLSLMFTPSPAQQYPTKPVNMFVGMAPGGATDIAMRAMATAAEKHLGQPIIVSNRGGGGGSIAYGLIAKEKPDGYHILGNSTTGLLYVPHLRDVPYTLDDFAPILIFGRSPGNGLVVRSNSPWKTFKDFIDYAKKNPGEVNFGTSGVGGATHIVMEFIAKQDGIKWTHVPYKGSSEVLAALIGGHIMAEAGGVKEFEDHIKSGTVRVLATFEEKRMKYFPSVPTIKELGYDCAAVIDWIVAAPKGTPEPVVKKLDEAFRKGMEDPKFIQTLESMQNEVLYRNAEETKQFIKETGARLGKFIKDLNLPKESSK